MNILLLDDEVMMLEMLQSSVEQAISNAEIVGFRYSQDALDFATNNKIDIAFLDINVPGISGLEMARELTKRYPKINIIFCTAYREYMEDAFDMYSSGYLMKPITPEKIKNALQHLRYPMPVEEKRVKITCFGNFEAFCDGTPIRFSLKKTKELLAYLVDRNGAECKTSEIIAVLFEDDNNREYYKKLRKDLIDTFTKLDIIDVLNVSYGGLSINREIVECDYFDFKNKKISIKPTEYMTQYSFAEETFASIC